MNPRWAAAMTTPGTSVRRLSRALQKQARKRHAPPQPRTPSASSPGAGPTHARTPPFLLSSFCAGQPARYARIVRTRKGAIEIRHSGPVPPYPSHSPSQVPVAPP